MAEDPGNGFEPFSSNEKTNNTNSSSQPSQAQAAPPAPPGYEQGVRRLLLLQALATRQQQLLEAHLRSFPVNTSNTSSPPSPPPHAGSPTNLTTPQGVSPTFAGGGSPASIESIAAPSPPPPTPATATDAWTSFIQSRSGINPSSPSGSQIFIQNASPRPTSYPQPASPVDSTSSNPNPQNLSSSSASFRLPPHPQGYSTNVAENDFLSSLAAAAESIDSWGAANTPLPPLSSSSSSSLPSITPYSVPYTSTFPPPLSVTAPPSSSAQPFPSVGPATQQNWSHSPLLPVSQPLLGSPSLPTLEQILFASSSPSNTNTNGTAVPRLPPPSIASVAPRAINSTSNSPLDFFAPSFVRSLVDPSLPPISESSSSLNESTLSSSSSTPTVVRGRGGSTSRPRRRAASNVDYSSIAGQSDAGYSDEEAEASTSTARGAGGEMIQDEAAAVVEDKRRRNTEASARFRAKKKLREREMADSSVKLREKVGDLEDEKHRLTAENKWLRDLVREKAVDLSSLGLSQSGYPPQPPPPPPPPGAGGFGSGGIPGI